MTLPTGAVGRPARFDPDSRAKLSNNLIFEFLARVLLTLYFGLEAPA